MVGKTKERTMKKKEETEKVPLEVTQFFCSLTSNLPRKEHILHYRAVTTLSRKEEVLLASEASIL